MKADDVKLQDLNLVELKKLENRIQYAIKDAEIKARNDALADIKSAAEKHGLTLDEVLGTSTKRSSKSSVPPKYQSPTDPNKTWSGRGRVPNWIKDFQASGGTLEELEIKK